MSVIGFGAAFEHSSAGLIVSAIYPGGPIHIANDQSQGNFVELQDRLTHIGGVSLVGKDKNFVGELMHGNPGTVVELRLERPPVRRGDPADSFAIDVTRQSSLRARSQVWRKSEEPNSPSQFHESGMAERDSGNYSPPKELTSTSPKNRSPKVYKREASPPPAIRYMVSSNSRPVSVTNSYDGVDHDFSRRKSTDAQWAHLGASGELIQTLITDNKQLRDRVMDLEDALMVSEERRRVVEEDVVGRTVRAHEILPKVHMLEDRLMQTERLVDEAARALVEEKEKAWGRERAALRDRVARLEGDLQQAYITAGRLETELEDSRQREAVMSERLVEAREGMAGIRREVDLMRRGQTTRNDMKVTPRGDGSAVRGSPSSARRGSPSSVLSPAVTGSGGKAPPSRGVSYSPQVGVGRGRRGEYIERTREREGTMQQFVDLNETISELEQQISEVLAGS